MSRLRSLAPYATLVALATLALVARTTLALPLPHHDDIAVRAVPMGSSAWSYPITVGDPVLGIDPLAGTLRVMTMATPIRSELGMTTTRATEARRDDQLPADLTALIAVGLTLFGVVRRRPRVPLVVAAVLVGLVAATRVEAPVGPLVHGLAIPLTMAGIGMSRRSVGLGLVLAAFIAAVGIGTSLGLDLPWRLRAPFVLAPTLVALGLILAVRTPFALAVLRAGPAAGDRRPLLVRMASAFLPGGEALRVSAAEAERAALATELHSGVLPVLAEAIRRVDKVDPETAALLRLTATELREKVETRRAVSLELLGLEPTLDGAIRKLVPAEIAVVTDFARTDVPAPAPVELAALRIAENALANAVAHAGARSIRVALRGDAHRLTLVVSDDGGGLDAAAAERARVSGRIGLVDMRVAAEAVGGTCEIRNAPGVSVEFRWPG